MSKTGRVFLVGAGPGDPELMTVKALRLLGDADVVVYDRLIAPAILDLVPAGTTRIDVGKAPGNHPVPQDETNALLARLARAGRRVVRLKGGDPFIFGRGSEEAIYLARSGVPYEVVPGITAAAGCAAAIGLPLTHRGVAKGVHFITGHAGADGKLAVDWSRLADPDTTLVVYMGLANIAEICCELRIAGLAPETPAVAVANGTTPAQQVCPATLETLAEAVTAAALEAPVLVVIGRVGGMIDALGLAADEAPAALARAGHG